MTMKYLVRFYKLDVPNHKTIKAIKIVREATGCKLLSAKKVVSGHHGEPPSLAIMSHIQYQRVKGLDLGPHYTDAGKEQTLRDCGYKMVLLDKKYLP